MLSFTKEGTEIKPEDNYLKGITDKENWPLSVSCLYGSNRSIKNDSDKLKLKLKKCLFLFLKYDEIASYWVIAMTRDILSSILITKDGPLSQVDI